MNKEKKKLNWWQKLLCAIGYTFGAILALVLTVLLVANVGKFAIFPNYYPIRELVCTNHGLNDNYVSQGTAVSDDGKYLITSGYMSDKTNSRVYITEIATDKTHFVKLITDDNKPLKHHFGGAAIEGDTIYLATKSTVFSLSLSEALENEELTVDTVFKVNNNASYIYTDSEYFYVGEFNDDGKYTTDHNIEHDGKTYNAICEKYDFDDLTKPVAVYATRNNVQGFAMTEDGDILLSTSFGLTCSKFYYYKANSVIDTEETLYDAPLYVLAEEDYYLRGPSMSEDLDYHNGKFYTNFESSSNKYIFGKFVFNSNKIVALDFSKLVK